MSNRYTQCSHLEIYKATTNQMDIKMIARKSSVIIDNNSSFSAHSNEKCKKKIVSLVISSIIQRSPTDCMENRF